MISDDSNELELLFVHTRRAEHHVLFFVNGVKLGRAEKGEITIGSSTDAQEVLYESSGLRVQNPVLTVLRTFELVVKGIIWDDYHPIRAHHLGNLERCQRLDSICAGIWCLEEKEAVGIHFRPDSVNWEDGLQIRGVTLSYHIVQPSVSVQAKYRSFFF